MQQYDDVALRYEQWIAPRYRTGSDGLAARCPLGPDDRVVEVAAGTGVLPRAFAASGQWPSRYLLTDISPGMLQVARSACTSVGRGSAFAVADCARLPLTNSQTDVVVCALRPVQDHLRWLREVGRVLRPGGRVAIAMWGPRYAEVRLHNQVRKQIGLRPFPPADAAGASRRLVQAGFVDVRREDVRQPVVHENRDAYLAYRRSFGRPMAWSEETYDAYYKLLSQLLAQRFDGGPVTLDWTISPHGSDGYGRFRRLSRATWNCHYRSLSSRHERTSHALRLSVVTIPGGARRAPLMGCRAGACLRQMSTKLLRP